jgi:hypothetical protein
MKYILGVIHMKLTIKLTAQDIATLSDMIAVSFPLKKAVTIIGSICEDTKHAALQLAHTGKVEITLDEVETIVAKLKHEVQSWSDTPFLADWHRVLNIIDDAAFEQASREDYECREDSSIAMSAR